MSVSEFQFRQMLARTNAGRRPQIRASDAVEAESDLRHMVLDLCRARGWAYISARPDQPSGIQVGAHDVTIFADGGRVFCFELKDREGKLSAHQRAWAALMAHNGHTVYVVRSLNEVVDVMLQPKLTE